MSNNSTIIVSTQATSLEKSLTDSKWQDEHAELIKKLESAYEAPAENVEQSSEAHRYCLRVSGINLIIDKQTPCELLEENNIFNLPLSENWLIGMTNVRGDIVPVIDFEQLLNNEDKKINLHDHRILVINKGENALGILIKHLPTSITFKEEEKITEFSDLTESLQAYAIYGYRKNNETWVCIDLGLFIQSFKT